MRLPHFLKKMLLVFLPIVLLSTKSAAWSNYVQGAGGTSNNDYLGYISFSHERRYKKMFWEMEGRTSYYHLHKQAFGLHVSASLWTKTMDYHVCTHRETLRYAVGNLKIGIEHYPTTKTSVIVPAYVHNIKLGFAWFLTPALSYRIDHQTTALNAFFLSIGIKHRFF